MPDADFAFLVPGNKSHGEIKSATSCDDASDASDGENFVVEFRLRASAHGPAFCRHGEDATASARVVAVDWSRRGTGATTGVATTASALSPYFPSV